MPGLDGLRGLAALSVVFQHFSTDARWYVELFQSTGAIGVALFFTLSGYLMGKLYAQQEFSPEGVRSFWVKRLARVVPLYLLLVFASYVWLGYTGTSRPLFTVSWDMLWAHLLFWDAQSVMWTIPREVQFYALFPLFWFALSRYGNVAYLGLLALLAIVAANGFESPMALFRPTVQYFIFGLIASRIDLRRSLPVNVLFVVAIALYFGTWPGILQEFGLDIVQGHVWQSPIYMALLPGLIVLAAHSSWADAILGRGVPAYLGTISYSLYLLHAPIFHTLNMYTPLGSMLPKTVFLLLDMAVVIAVSSASYFLFERPLRNLIGQLARPTVKPGLRAVEASA